MGFLSNRAVQEALPSGIILPYAGSSAPDGWLFCNGAAVDRIAYSRLFNAISTSYGIGDGVNTFNLPNTQGVFLRGAGSQILSGLTYSTTRGSSQTDSTKKNGLTASASSSSVSGTVGGSDGTHSHSLTGTVYVASDEGFASGGNGGEGGNNGTVSSTTTSGGHGHSHSLTAAAQAITIGAGDAETRPANLGVNYIIKT
jgi:microcystin-dependent protein